MEKQLSTIKKTELIFNKDEVKERLNDMLGDRSSGFITSVLSAVSQNDLLKNADPNSVYMSAMMAASLDLPINSNLGLAYIIPYNVRQKDGSYKTMAQFQIGYKGFIQLAIRSGQFRTISATPVFEGQLIEMDRLKGYRFDWENKTGNNVIGYAAYFELLNGMQKTFYLTKEEIEEHGNKYSKTFSNKYGIWQKDFDAMATKTVLKLLLSKYAPLSIEMQQAVLSDQGVIKNFDTLDIDYNDNPETVETIDPLLERSRILLEEAETIEELEQVKRDIGELPEELESIYVEKSMYFVELEEKNKEN